MAEELQGGLTLAGAAPGAPNPATNPLAALQAQAMGNAEKKQGYLEQQQEAYNRDMAQYAQMVEQSRLPENNEAAKWGSMAGAAADVAPQWGNIGQMLGKTGQAYGNFQEQQQTQDLKNQGDLTKLRQAEVRALEAKDQSAALMKTLYGQNKGFEPRRNADGTTTVYDKNTGIPVGTYGPQDIGKITELTKTLAKAAVDKGDYKTLDEATQWAHGEAIRIVTASSNAVGNRTAPLAGNVGGVPTTPQPGIQATQALPTAATAATTGTVEGSDKATILAKELAKETEASNLATTAGDTAAASLHQNNVAQLQEMVAALPEAQRVDVDRNLRRYLANPNAGTVKGLEASLVRTGAMPKLDVAKQAMEKGTGEETGKALGKEHEALNAGASASGKMLTQLDLMKSLYANPNMPEGELGPLIQQIKSGLKSVGVTVGPDVGAADLARAVASNFALHLRTGEGTNLMPGAMSNYEDKLLQQMAPVLSLTAEGRNALVEAMQEMAKSNMRVSQEANKMAAANRGILPSDWRTRKERIMKEEMARLTHVNDQVMQRFNKGAQ